MSHIDALLQCVDEQSELLNDFIQVLEAEGALLLETPSNEALGALTTRKNDYARRLSELDQARAATLASMGQADDRASIDVVCALHPDLRPAFDTLFERAAHASALNQDNGQILKTFMEHNQQALDTLRGLMGQDLYDARGRLSKK
ncbi:flagella synthesis protein FlgN [uncultured Castellaniella sp.]|uniref:flagella synthesis protein FlgN n=1 Tax=uncultured Castellaniella sp. TaxID=647907 RepID=UPI00262165D7|nr:flagellar protein FlgN [uncultured Castellaniella sp.]